MQIRCAQDTLCMTRQPRRGSALKRRLEYDTDKSSQVNTMIVMQHGNIWDDGGVDNDDCQLHVNTRRINEYLNLSRSIMGFAGLLADSAEPLSWKS